MKINKYIKECHEIAVNKGFYGCPLCAGTGYRENSKEICSICEGTGENKYRNIPELLMLIVSEVSEALEAHRKGKEEMFKEELADVFIRLFDMCGYMDIDIEPYIKNKMEYNKTRPHKHNKKY